MCDGARVELPLKLPLPEYGENTGVWFRRENITGQVLIINKHDQESRYEVNFDGITVNPNTQAIVIHDVRHEHEGRYIPHGLDSIQRIHLKIRPAKGIYNDLS